jgi:hypothetical protein
MREWSKFVGVTCEAHENQVPSIESWRKLKYSDKSAKYGIVDTIEGLPGFSRRLGWIWNVWKLPCA